MISPHLEAERSRLVNLIEQIRHAGEIAPAYCWLTQTTSTKGDRTYTYALLVSQKPDHKPKSQSLGKPGSQKHRHWQAAIVRRDQINELEQQLSMLQTLIERQIQASVISIESM